MHKVYLGKPRVLSAYYYVGQEVYGHTVMGYAYRRACRLDLSVYCVVSLAGDRGELNRVVNKFFFKHNTAIYTKEGSF